MKQLAFALVLASSAAFADIAPGPSNPSCEVPASCTTCSMYAGETGPAEECKANAIDAGLIESECTDTRGLTLRRYFCPKGTMATRGCSSVDVLGLSALAALLFRRRR